MSIYVPYVQYPNLNSSGFFGDGSKLCFTPPLPRKLHNMTFHRLFGPNYQSCIFVDLYTNKDLCTYTCKIYKLEF